MPGAPGGNPLPRRRMTLIDDHRGKDEGDEEWRRRMTPAGTEPRPILFIVNPASGRGAGKKLIPLIERFLADALQGEIYCTEKAGDARRRAARAVEDGFVRVAAAGGDGTISEVAAGLMGTGAELILIPGGTGNDLVRHLGLSLNPAKRLLELTDTRVLRMDMGCANGQPFVLAVGAGFDAAVAAAVNRGVRWASGSAAYAIAVVQTLLQYRPTEMRVETDGSVVEFKGYFAVVANARGYGGGMKIAPDASVADGLLDICCVRAVPRVRLLAAAGLVYTGRHVAHPAVSMHRARTVSIESNPPVPIVIDGEPGGMTPLKVTVLPAALRVAIPSASSGPV